MMLATSFDAISLNKQGSTVGTLPETALSAPYNSSLHFPGWGLLTAHPPGPLLG